MNKEELKERLDDYYSRVGYMKGAVIKISRGDLHDLIDQLDEPEVLSQECIEQKSIDTHVDTLNGEVQFTFELEDLQNLLVPKQEDINKEKQEAYVKGFEAGEKQTVEFYEEHESKDFNKKVNQLIKAIENPKRIKLRDVIERMDALSEKNRNDWIERINERYEVEEEQKYNIKFKVKSSFGTVGIFLYKKGDEVLAGDNFEVYYPKEDEYRLTEQEIRDFQNGDILFEHFAVKVEELEE